MSKRAVDGASTSRHICHHPYRQQRRDSAAKLVADRATRSAKQQLALLDRRFGPDQGATKERARLHAQLEAEAVAEAKDHAKRH